jgi:hypothetical protein
MTHGIVRISVRRGKVNFYPMFRPVVRLSSLCLWWILGSLFCPLTTSLAAISQPLGYTCWDPIVRKHYKSSNLNRGPFRDDLPIDGREPTDNKNGFNSPPEDEITRLWMEDSKSEPWAEAGNYGPVPGTTWELGSAWGWASRELLEMNPLVHVYVNDKHLVHVNLGYLRTAEDLRPRYHRVWGSVPKELHIPDEPYFYREERTRLFRIRKSEIPDNSMWNILAADLFHFFKPEEIEETFEYLFPKLMLGGSIYVKAFTPYVVDFEDFVPIYEGRLTGNEVARKYGLPEPWSWPGYDDEVKARARRRGKHKVNKQARLRVKNLPNPWVNWLDLHVLTRTCLKFGYEVTWSGYLNPTNIITPEMTDPGGKTIVGIVCTKTRREMIRRY